MFAFYPLLSGLSLYLPAPEMKRVEKAFLFAADAHETQFRSSGEPYVTHTVAAATILAHMHLDADTIIAALLHDVVEDTDWTLDQLRQAGFAEEVVQAVECLTHRDRETYEEFIARVQTNPIATKVKLADLEDNIDMRRLSAVTAQDVQRLHKYHHAWLALRQVSHAEGETS